MRMPVLSTNISRVLAMHMPCAKHSRIPNQDVMVPATKIIIFSRGLRTVDI